MAEIKEFTSKQARKQMDDYEKTINRLIGQYGKLDKAIAALNREINKEEKTTKKLSEAQKLANQQKNKLNKVNAKLAASENKITKQLILQEQKLKASNKALRDQANAAAGIKKTNGLFKSMAKSMIAVGVAAIGIRTVFNVLKNNLKTIANFEEAMSKVRAVAGALPKEFKQLTDNAKMLGSTTSKTATEVSGLQLEFSKLGFSTREILNATEATISLSIAAGSDLAESAVVAASTVRGFGLDASETQRVVDVMAKSFSSSALDLEKFKTSMSAVAPVAKANGKDIEFVSARLSVLSDAGLDASTSGTSLRNMFLTLSKEGLSWEEGLEKINTAQDKNVAALDLFGKRGATAALILADNIEKADGLEKAYDKSAGTALKMAKIMEDNLIGDTKKLSSAWEGLILRFGESDGAIVKLSRGIVQLATKMIGGNKATKERVDLLKLENNQMDASFEALKSGKLSRAAQIKLISKINTEYREYLPQLLTEKTSLEDIKKAQDQVNKAYKTKIIQQAFQEQINELMQKELEILEGAADAEIAVAEQRAGISEDQYKSESEVYSLKEKQLNESEKLNNLLTDGLIDRNKEEIESTRERFKKIAELYNIAFSEIESILQSNQEITEDTEKETIRILAKSGKEKASIKAKSVQVTSSLADEEVKIVDDSEKRKAEIEEKARKDKEEAEALHQQAMQYLRQQTFNQGVDLVNNLFNLQQAKSQAELSNLNRDYDARIAAAEGNDELQERLEKERAQKQYKIELEQAKLQKQQALFNVFVSSGVGIANAWASSLAFGPAGPIIAATLTGLMVANAAVQTAAIQATPLPTPPQFALGTDYSPSTFIAGEAGRELMFGANGQALLTPNKSTLYTGMEGTKILPNAETEAILAATNLHATGAIDTKQLSSKLDNVVSAIENNTPYMSFDKHGVINYGRKKSDRNKRINRKFHS